jgi:hypothetical protein
MRRTTAHGYGKLHKRLRAREAKRVAAGEAFCAAPRCKHPRGRWIAPSEPWDLGHHPFDRSRYLGPMHRGCNRNTVLERSRRRPRVVRASAGAWL